MSHGDPYRAPGEARQHSDPKTDARIAMSRERTKQVVAARVRGLSWAQVGLEVGISRSQAHKLWKAETEGNPVENLHEERSLLIAKLQTRERRANRIIALHEKEMFTDGTPLARREKCARVIASQQVELDRVQDTIAKVQGAYAPTKHQVMGENGGAIPVEVVSQSEVLARIAKIAGEKPAPALDPVKPEEPAAPNEPESPEGDGIAHVSNAEEGDGGDLEDLAAEALDDSDEDGGEDEAP